ncbi:hypothetical protein HKB47_20980 [Mesorhizobium japonicum]|uniref:Uncharacterized protein n=3 Tax=Mesorhizobium TaxID=68287 RepID=A0A1A5J5M3_RHILI|nr:MULTISPECIES: hypothetical protein [Mesorhizobium]ETA72664.1 hypothetical protein MesloDRAFT_1544 [Mesorhizobium japonicum R7A]MBE1711166.1 hypothetical protein [Mesorhizobium japonicum]MBE1714659.1 hypothetical protein [Mesorhizobium japonicum]MUT22270.1 hypothetical protein [Mesorhizobium japonicum]MUT28309.1 hypothetical protein [Mesorhizobium japonicum]
MSANFTLSDRNMISKPLQDMSEAEREMLRRRVEQAAEALDGAASPEFGKLVALALLERHGLSKGSMSNVIDSTPLPKKGPQKSSIYARRSDNFSQRDFS